MLKQRVSNRARGGDLSRSSLPLDLFDVQGSRGARPQQFFFRERRVEPVQPLLLVEDDHLAIVYQGNVRSWLACEHREGRGSTFDGPPQTGDAEPVLPCLVKRHLSFGDRFPVNS